MGVFGTTQNHASELDQPQIEEAFVFLNSPFSTSETKLVFVQYQVGLISLTNPIMARCSV